ncbi:glutathione S-transferase family protein [Pelistega ratti]|uniref:glutathione S-transferase family protein n=1 Tax=Pelistega ratti TaxID=2652177 RepID=UPI00135BC6B3|nr:glutathione S-transferase family protein [Pelistega ratti]
MITLYHINTVNAYKIIYLLEELQLTYHISNEQTLPETVNIPCYQTQAILIEHQHTIVGFLAITDYLLNQYDRKGLRPPITSTAYLTYQQWNSYIETVLQPLLLQYEAGKKLANARVPFFARSIIKKTVSSTLQHPIETEFEQHLNYIEQHLSQYRWVCDNYFSLIDIQLSEVLDAVPQWIQEEKHPNIIHFLNSMKERPAYSTTKDKLSFSTHINNEETIEQA